MPDSHRPPLVPFLSFCLLAVCRFSPLAAEDGLRRHAEWHAHLAAQPTMRLVSATYFGAGGCEAFGGGVGLADGALVYGNSWGEPFPAVLRPEVIGADAPVDLPLFRTGLDRGPDGKPIPPSPHHPNRTGFLVRYDRELTAVRSVTRFGWGVATIDAALRLADGGVVIAGTARPGFAGTAGRVERIEAPPGVEGVGPVVFEGVSSPGDTYVARLSADLSGLDWAVIFAGHRRPPRLFATPAGGLVVDTACVYRMGDDGSDCTRIACEREIRAGGTRFLAGVLPDGGLLFAGSRLVGSDRDHWLGPLVERCRPDGRPAELFYDWSVELVEHGLIGLRSPSPVRAAAVTPDGEVLLASRSLSTDSVLLRDPKDLLESIPHAGLGLIPHGDSFSLDRRRGRARRGILVRFDASSGDGAVAGLWFGKDGYAPATVDIEGIAPLADGRVAVWGTAGRWLLQTTTEYFRAGDQPKLEYRDYKPRRPGKDDEPEPLALGGTGPYAAIFTRDFTGLLWSSAMARCRVADVVQTPAGTLVVGTSLTAAAGEAEDVNRPAAVRAPQPDFGGGVTDGHCYLVTGP